MIKWWRWLLRLILIVMVSFIERTMGLPIITFFLIGLYAARLDQEQAWSLMILMSLSVAALFMSPWALVWVLIGASYLWVKHTQTLMSSRLIRLIVGSSVSSIVISLTMGSLSWSQLIYGVLAVVGCVIWLKRYRLYLK